MKSRNGFTIIELLISLAIFSIIITMAIGLGVDPVGRAGLKGSSNELIGEINTLRGKAAKENRPVALSFTETTYKEHYFESGIWNPILTEHSPVNGQIATGTTISSSSTIVFNSQGILVDPTTFQIRGNITLTLTSEQSEGIKIRVYSYGGIKIKNTWRNSNEYASF